MYKEANYRGQHVIRETIKRKVEKLRTDLKEQAHNYTDSDLWEKACELIYEEFTNEGLISSAEQVLDHKLRGK